VKIYRDSTVFVAIFSLFSLLTFSPVYASTISLIPQDATPKLGASVSIDLLMDFSDNPTLGGGLDIIYNATALDFLSFTFDSTFLGVTDSSFSCPGAASCPSIDQANTVFNIAFGNFSGLGGPYIVGTLIFNTLTPGTSLLSTAETTGPAGPFVSVFTYQPQSVTYLGTSITTVPIPAAIYLFASGLLGLFASSRSLTNS
jgi:hypothetical protein